jgi:hypothetical protein
VPADQLFSDRFQQGPYSQTFSITILNLSHSVTSCDRLPN